MAIKEFVTKNLLSEVLNPTGDLTSSFARRKDDWKVLVVDNLGMRIMSSCFKMQDLSDAGITLVEDILRNREPIQCMEAIYFITPTEDSINGLLRDFKNKHNPMYRAAYVYFTEEIPSDLFEKLKKFPVRKYMKACQEINISFVPYETQVFSLDNSEFFQYWYAQRLVDYRSQTISRIAEQIATLCCTLDEYPSIRARSQGIGSAELGNLIKTNMEQLKEQHPTMGEGASKSHSQLILIDRGFDCVTPLLHELTLQAMAYDLLPIQNDVFKYNSSRMGGEKEVILDETCDLWEKIRHQHIADVLRNIKDLLKDFNKNGMADRMKIDENTNLKELSRLMKEMPQYHKELSKYATQFNLVEQCFAEFKKDVEKLCKEEQNIVMGVDSNGEPITDIVNQFAPILLSTEYTNEDKARIIALYVLSKNGVTEQNLNKLFQFAEFEDREKTIVRNLKHLGCDVVIGENPNPSPGYPRRNRDSEETKYTLSRWTPVIKDIIEDCIEGKLNAEQFPFIHKNIPLTSLEQTTKSARYGNWRKEIVKTKDTKRPRLIVFVVGGLTYSEMRTAYEVTKNNENWEVLVGSTHILTPKQFLGDLFLL